MKFGITIDLPNAAPGAAFSRAPLNIFLVSMTMSGIVPSAIRARQWPMPSGEQAKSRDEIERAKSPGSGSFSRLWGSLAEPTNAWLATQC